MAFDQSFNNQSSVFSISVMVVDDDPVFLQIMARMLEKSKYRDPSITELTVVTVKNSMEALSTLKIKKNNIDLIVTDHYMPGMTGLQLKAEITREFGNLPVIVISSDNNKEQESLSCGAKYFIPKPIKAIDLTKIYELAITSKSNGKSILQLEHNHKETDISVPKQIQLRPEQVNVLKTKCLTKSDSRSVNSTNEIIDSTNGSRKNPKRKSIGGHGGDGESSRPSKKKKITWTDFLHDRFLQAIRHIGLDKAVPKKILEFMNVPDLTRENVASHLQKYRIFLRKVAEEGSIHSIAWLGRDIESMLPYDHFKELYDNYFKHSNSWYDTSLNDRSFYSQPRIGYGQSRLLSNPPEPVRSNPIPCSNMNRSSTNEFLHHIGSNLTVPIRSNLSFSNQQVMANKMGQTSQVLGFGQHRVSSVHGNNFNKNMMSSNGNSTFIQPRLSNYGSFTLNQLGLNDYRTSTLYQPGLSSYGSLTTNQLGMGIYGSSTPIQSNLNGYGRLTPTQPGLLSYEKSTIIQQELSSNGSATPTQPRLRNYRNSTLNQQELNSYGSATPTQPGLMSYGNSTLNQQEMSNYGSANQLGSNTNGSLSPNQLRSNTYGSLYPNQLGPSNYESPNLNKPGSSHFGYGRQSFLNNENASYMTLTHGNTTTQPNVDISHLANLNKTNELPCNTSNFYFDQNKQQGEVNNFESPAKFATELDQIFSLRKNDDQTFVNINQDHSAGEMSNTFTAPDTNSTVFNMNPNHNQDHPNGEASNIFAAPETNSTMFDMNPNHNHNQEQDPDFIDWSLLDMQDLVDDDFMNSLLNNDMN